MGKSVANTLLFIGLLAYLFSFYLPFGIQPKGAAYIFFNAFSILNFPEDPALRILGGIFIWLPTIVVLLIVFSRLLSISKWIIMPLMVIILIQIGLMTYDSQSDNMILGLPTGMGAAYWTWVASVILIFISQMIYWRSYKA